MSKHRNMQGADLHAPSNERVENNYGAIILKETAVTFTSIGTLYPQIFPAVGGVDVVRGITQTDIPPGGNGYVTTLGFMAGVNTNIWNPGTRLFATATGALSSVTNGLPIGVVLKKNATSGVIYVDNTGITQGDLLGVTFPPDAELEFMWAVAFPKPYKEFSYNGSGDVIDFDVYDGPAKTTHIFNKHFSYDVGGNLTTIVSSNLISGLTKTRTISYNINGEMISEVEA